jgi:hypothetical protein
MTLGAQGRDDHGLGRPRVGLERMSLVRRCGLSALLLVCLALPSQAQMQGTVVGAPLTFSGIAGEATDAQIPNLNTLGTGLTGSRCVETTAGGLLTVAAAPCSSGGAGNPGGTTTQLQYNNAGVFGGTTGLIYADPLTLAAAGSGWKFGANGLSANLANSTTGNDMNFRRALDLVYSEDGSNTNTNFSTSLFVNMARTTSGPGQNERDAVAKSTYALMALLAQDRAQGQHFLTTNTMYSWAMGDAYLADYTHYVWGWVNAAGDEGQGIFRLVLEQQSALPASTITSMPAQSTCNTTLTQAVTKNVAVQTVTVASSTGCSVNDRVVIDAGNMVGSKPRMEVVKLTAVGAGTISGKFRSSHVSGDTVQPTVQLVIGGNANMGAGRYAVNMTSVPYTTGIVASISGTGFVGSGTTWAPTMVGGSALIPGCISLTADNVTTSPFSAGAPLRGWFGIASVTDTTHLNIAHSKEAASVAAYKGKGVGTDGTYTIRACARILDITSNSLYLEPNSFVWTAGDTVHVPHSVDLSVTSLIRAQATVYSPNVELTTMIGLTNYGYPFGSAIHSPQIGSSANFNTFFSLPVHVSGAMFDIQGAIDSGILMNLSTSPTDGKLIRWNTSGSPVWLGADHVSGALFVRIPDNPALFFEVQNNIGGYEDVKSRQWLSVSIAFANLGTPANGTMVYCADCAIANPCAGSGTGAFAKRLNSAWICN